MFFKRLICIFKIAHDGACVRVRACVFQGDCEGLSEALVKDRLRQVLTAARPSVTLSGHPAESAYIKVIYVCVLYYIIYLFRQITIYNYGILELDFKWFCAQLLDH